MPAAPPLGRPFSMRSRSKSRSSTSSSGIQSSSRVCAIFWITPSIPARFRRLQPLSTSSCPSKRPTTPSCHPSQPAPPPLPGRARPHRPPLEPPESFRSVPSCRPPPTPLSRPTSGGWWPPASTIHPCYTASSATTGWPASGPCMRPNAATTCLRPRARRGSRSKPTTTWTASSKYHSSDPCRTSPRKRSRAPRRAGASGWPCRTGCWGLELQTRRGWTRDRGSSRSATEALLDGTRSPTTKRHAPRRTRDGEAAFD